MPIVRAASLSTAATARPMPRHGVVASILAGLLLLAPDMVWAQRQEPQDQPPDAAPQQTAPPQTAPQQSAPQQTAPQRTEPQPTREQVLRQAPGSFAPLARDKLPAVVTITAASRSDRATTMDQAPFAFPPGSPWEEFFEDFFGDRGGPDSRAVPPIRSLGSGFVIDPSGLIVTNSHVVAEADEIEVQLHDDRTLPVTVVGTDPATDLALIRVEPGEPLPALTFGPSDEALVGDWVVAIGNPFGLGGTVTAGIISARAREIGAGNYDDFIQTDAAINTGNSGGPLLNMAGEVIGVNTAIFSRTGGNIGIGFAVPSDLAADVIDELRETGFVTRGYLGVTIQQVTPEIADALGLEQRQGVLVASVSPDSPARSAGLQPGDLVLSLDGEPVTQPRDLSRRVADLDPGQQVTLTVLRDGDRRDLQVAIGELPREPDEVARATDPDEGSLGLTLAPVTPALRDRFGLEADADGAVVTDVAPGSIAEERGFQPGDLITRADRQPVEGPQDFVSAVARARKAGRDSVLVLRQTGQGAVFVPLPVTPRAG